MSRPGNRLQRLEHTRRKRAQRETTEIWIGYDEPGAIWQGPHGRTCTADELPADAQRIVMTWEDTPLDEVPLARVAPGLIEMLTDDA